MIDHFALLREPRRPWIDPDVLKAKFLSLAAEVHPDRVHASDEATKNNANSRYADLNAAFQHLSKPRDRLLHLFELESGSRPKDIQRIPPGTMDLFVEIGQACRDADAFLLQRNRVTSPLLKVQFFERGQALVEQLQALQQKVNAARSALEGELQELNPVWEKAPPPGDPERADLLPIERLEEIYRVLSYTTRWAEQVQERLVQLAF